MAKKEGIAPKPVKSIRANKQEKLTKTELEKQLIDNFVNLQRVLTNLSVKFDNLSENISKLLQLFEISAKSFVEKLPEGATTGVGKEKDREFLSKIDTLLEQNKTIAKGLTLMEEKLRERIYGSAQYLPPERREERPRFPKI